MGRSRNAVLDDVHIAANLKRGDRYQLIQQVTSQFWDLWAQQVTPESVMRQKWHSSGRNLKLGDVVLLHEKSAFKGKYQLGIVSSIRESQDNLVRSCKVTYTIPNRKDPVDIYTGGRKVEVSRSV